MATENGQELKYLDQITGPASEVPTDEEAIECLDVNDNIKCKFRKGCRWTAYSLRPQLMFQGFRGCVNKHFPQSAQRHKLPRGKSFGDREMEQWNTQYRRIVHLTNPTASSSKPDKPPSRVLQRQVAFDMERSDEFYKEYFSTHSKPFPWGVANAVNDDFFFRSSCWMPSDDRKGDNNQFWKADFLHGTATIDKV